MVRTVKTCATGMPVSVSRPASCAVSRRPLPLAHVAAPAGFEVFPTTINLETAGSEQSLVARVITPDGVTRDVTAEVQLCPARRSLAAEGNILRPVADGAGELKVTYQRSDRHDSGEGEGCRGRPPDQLQARRDAGLHESRLQHRRLPRRGPRQGRVPPLALRLRPRRRLPCGSPASSARAGSIWPFPRKACSSKGARARSPTPAARASRTTAALYTTLMRWLEAGAPQDPPHRRHAGSRWRSSRSRSCWKRARTSR